MGFPPKKNTAYSFFIAVISQTNPSIFQNAPTIAAGDFKVSIDGAALNNLATLPVVTPPASKIIKVSLSAAEMNGDDINVIWSDQAGAEWADGFVNLKPTLRTIDDLTYPGYQLADLAATDGVIPTIEQALYMINQYLSEREVVGTTVTVKKPDGSTALMTFSLNSPTNPTSITRT